MWICRQAATKVAGETASARFWLTSISANHRRSTGARSYLSSSASARIVGVVCAGGYRGRRGAAPRDHREGAARPGPTGPLPRASARSTARRHCRSRGCVRWCARRPRRRPARRQARCSPSPGPTPRTAHPGRREGRRREDRNLLSLRRRVASRASTATATATAAVIAAAVTAAARQPERRHHWWPESGWRHVTCPTGSWPIRPGARLDCRGRGGVRPPRPRQSRTEF